MPPLLSRRSLLALIPVTIVESKRAVAAAAEPWDDTALIEPKDFAELLDDSTHPRPVVVYVGFPSLYNGAHIRNSVLAGPGSKPEGIDQLRQVVKLLPKTKEIVIYCGCCPFDHCPNVRPAYSFLKDAGFSRVSVLRIPTNLHADWVAKGYPTTKGPSL